MPQVFDFPFHKVTSTYPNRGRNITLGNNWDYAARPHTPPAKQFRLTFAVMKFFDPAITTTGRLAQIDLQRLIDFYELHEMHEEFLYEHPIYGNLIVKFSAPLEIPEGETGADGAVLNVVVQLKEVPFS